MSLYSPVLSWFFPPLVLVQAALLHPAFRHSSSARAVRKWLTFPAAVLALRFPVDHKVEPRNFKVAFNCVVGYWSVHGACLALQFGLSNAPFYRTKRQNAKKSDDAGSDNGKDERDADTVTPFELLKYVISLIYNLRGIGWSWQLPARVLPLPEQEGVLQLFRRVFFKIVVLHAFMIALEAIMIPAYLLKHPADVWTYWLGTAPPAAFIPVAPYLATLVHGFVTFAGLELGGIQIFLVVAILKSILRLVLPASIAPEPVQYSDYVPLSNRPYARNSVSEFWTYGWHACLRRDFTSCGGYPLAVLLRPLGRTASRCGTVVGTFALSGFLHDYALTLASPNGQVHTSAMVFFLTQASGVIGEETFTRLSGRRVGGGLGRAWMYAFLTLTSVPFTIDMLEASGMAQGILLPKEWGWKQLLLPGAATEQVVQA